MPINRSRLLFALVKFSTKNQYFVLQINNLGVSILYVDAFSFTQMLHRTKHELNWLSGVVGCGAQIEFTQKLHRLFRGE
jgi:hypothetical protein